MPYRLSDVIERMYTWVDEILAIYYDSYFITMNAEFNVAYATTFPVVVIDIDPTKLDEMVFGRLTPSEGSSVTYIFTLYMYQKFDAFPTDNYSSASTLAIRLSSGLVKKNQNATEISQYGIWSVSIAPSRPSETGIGELARYIMPVSVEALRIDPS